ncbi:unnamed protein product [Bemisia tabaci]|uniref:Uncharacterized protein n=1 Tax=Bemisia tabaci TaxID=7038 RepID=A0A9P0F2F8_BEMTA|nr:unnamed protein product [Bemisia tabaci]
MNLGMSGFIRQPLVESPQASIFANPLATGMDRFPYPNSMPNMSAPSMPWAQIPPINVPWGIPPNNLPDVIRFNATPNINTFQPIPRPIENGGFPRVRFTKRKTNIEPEIPAKIHVTDEKMAAHMSEMHISSNYTSHETPVQPNFSCSNFETKQFNDKLTSLISSDDKEDIKIPSIKLCEELRKLSKTPILPEPLLQVEKPCRALVLWKPPPGVVESNIATIASSYTTNNNCSVVTYQTSPTSTVTITELTDEDKPAESIECDPIPSTSTGFMDSAPISSIPEPIDYEMES